MTSFKIKWKRVYLNDGTEDGGEILGRADSMDEAAHKVLQEALDSAISFKEGPVRIELVVDR